MGCSNLIGLHLCAILQIKKKWLACLTQVNFLLNRKVHTESSERWLERLKAEKVPVVVCLTFADRLYTEIMHKKSGDKLSELLDRELNVCYHQFALYLCIRYHFCSLKGVH